MGKIIGVDVGGTFTDVVVFDREEGRFVARSKRLSTPRKPQDAVIRALNDMRSIWGDIDVIVHATTIATNALLGQIRLELPKTALITTKGFKDVIEIGRQRRPSLYDLFFEKPRPLVTRRFRFEVDERVDGDGKILKAPPTSDLEKIVNAIVENGIISIAICFINSYLNNRNEKYVKDFLSGRLKERFICASYEVDNQYREYERMSTTIINATLMPIVTRYLSELKRFIERIMPKSELLIMKSDGGVSKSEFIINKPITIIESGPAAGVIATRFIGSLLGISELLSFDMGGTTAKAGTIIGGEPLITIEYEVGGKVHAGRIIKGSGYPVRYSFIDLAEVSSGGGSIIWIDEAGALKVGPVSAGSDPGPACYGKGGEKPTITDAHVLLNSIADGFALGGEIKVWRDLALKAFRKNIDIMDPIEASISAIKIANSVMAKILRIVTVERGLDPKEFTLVAFGGAGPMHACSLAMELGISSIIIPIYPGLFSALGLVASDYKHVYYKPLMKTTGSLEKEEIIEAFRSLHDSVLKDFKSLGLSKRIIINNFVDARYLGQGYELRIPVNPNSMSPRDIEKAFHEIHRRTYGYAIEEFEVEIINVRVEAISLLTNIRLRKIERSKRVNGVIGTREVFFESTGDFELARVYDRDRLSCKSVIEGPAIVESYDSTIVIEPGWIGEVDEYGNIIVRRR